MGVVEIEEDDKLYQAKYFLDENVVTIHGDSGSESTQLGELSEEQVAKMLLHRLILKGNMKLIVVPGT